jgi:Uma2 family endonuclease
MWHVTPEFVIELKSASDRLTALREKMREWTANGVPLAWLVIPETQTVEIYRGDGSAQEVCQPAELAGEGPVQGFVLRL